MFLGLVYKKKKKKKKKKDYPLLLDSHDPKWTQELIKDGISLLLFFFLIHELLVHALISLPAHLGRIGAQAVFPVEKSGGGGPGCLVLLRLVYLTSTGHTRYAIIFMGSPCLATLHPLGSHSASVH